jgi:hypothetical protein
MIRLPPINVSGFLNMLVAAKDAKVKRLFMQLALPYGDSAGLPR